MDDIVIEKASKPFSSVSQSSRSNQVIMCSLCANAGVESIVKDDICAFCGDVGIKHGISKDDELFVVNSVGGSDDSSNPSENSLYFGSFGGFQNLDEKKRPQQTRSLQQALKESEI